MQYQITEKIHLADMPTVKHAAFIDTNETIAMPVTPLPTEAACGPAWALYNNGDGTYTLVFYTVNGALEFALDTKPLALFARTLQMRCCNLDARGPMPTESQVL